MSQNPYSQLGADSGGPFPYGPDVMPTDPGRTSVLAVIALVISICGCVCPIFVVPGALAMVLGGIAVILIATSGARIRGLGLATTAICLGLLQTVVVALFYFGVYRPTVGFIDSAWVGPVDHFMSAAESGDAKGALSELTQRGQDGITPEQIADFVTRYHAEVGKYKSAPTGPIEIFQAFSQLGQAMSGMNSTTQAGGSPNGIPVAANFEKTPAVLVAQIDEKAKHQHTSGAPTKPPILNIGILTNDGKSIWLLAPDEARQLPEPGAPPSPGPKPPRGQGRPRPPVLRPERYDAETGAIRFTNTLPLGLDLQKDRVKELELNSARQIVGGKPSKFAALELRFSSDRALLVRQFAEPEGKTMVQVRMDKRNSRFGLVSDVAEGLDLDKPITIIDDHDTATAAVGFVARDENKDVWISYQPDTPLLTLNEKGMPVISRDHSGNELVLLFLVDSGSKITEIRVGDHALVKFDPPLEAKRDR
jgi:hypothetical protein